MSIIKNMQHVRRVRHMRCVCLGLCVFFALFTMAHGITVRIKDIVNFEGVRSNQLIGYGLVVGLNGTGDDLKNPYTLQSTISMLDRFGIAVRENLQDLKGKNIAAVIVTAESSLRFQGMGHRSMSMLPLWEAQKVPGRDIAGYTTQGR